MNLRNREADAEMMKNGKICFRQILPFFVQKERLYIFNRKVHFCNIIDRFCKSGHIMSPFCYNEGTVMLREWFVFAATED